MGKWSNNIPQVPEKREPKEKAPRKRKAKVVNHEWCVDFESTKWTVGLVGVAKRDDGEQVVFQRPHNGQRYDFAAPDPFGSMADFARREGGTWRAHGGGIFDFLRMSAYGLPDEVLLSGSVMLRAKHPKVSGRAPYIWRDTLPWWLCSLETIGKKLGLPKMPDVDRSKLVDMDPKDLLAYCERDVDVLQEGVRRCQAFFVEHGAKVANTSGSSAVSLLKVLDPTTWEWLEATQPPVETHERCAGKIRGGRVETRVVGRVPGPIYSYDVHSSYPASYFDGPLPIGLNIDRGLSLQGTWWGCCEWTITPDDLNAGPGLCQLPPPDLGDGNRGIGKCTAWLTSESAGWFRECGVEVKRIPDPETGVLGFRPAAFGSKEFPNGAKLTNFAHEFAKTMFAEKEGGGPNSFFAKVFLNSLAGKLGMKADRVTWKLAPGPQRRPDAPSGYYVPNITRPHVLEPYQQPMSAAFVLQRARIRLSRALRALVLAGWEVYYYDTDAVHTNCPPAEVAKIIDLGDGLGQFGLEATATSGIYLASKMYCLNLVGGKTKMAAKGVRKDTLTPDVFWDAMQGGDLALRRRSGLKKFRAGRLDLTFGEKQQLERHIKPVTNYRARIPSGRGFWRLNYRETK